MSLLEQSAAFINYIDELVHHLKPIKWSDAVTDSGRTAVLAVDIINGFCYVGNLASPRIAAHAFSTTRFHAKASVSSSTA